jgi:putative heme-binding domain-containing protein
MSFRTAVFRKAMLASFCCLLLGHSSSATAQSLDEILRQTPVADLVSKAKADGDAARGAVVFFQQQMACSKCHSVAGWQLGDLKGPGFQVLDNTDLRNTMSNQVTLGPDLAALASDTTDESLVESVLTPSKQIRKGFESVTLVTGEGQSVVGILAERTAEKIVIRDVTRNGELVTYVIADLDEVLDNPVSIMPAGQMNQLASSQQFYDLIRYLMEIRDGGAARAKELQPSAALLTLKIPEYEQHIDHAGFIRDWDDDAFKRGEAIYRRVCQNCHGTKDQAGSLPTSLKFASGKFRSGSDPYTMYQTLTKGFGLMAAQTWMVPSQKYDVIHYIRETYLKPHNPSQFVEINEALLAKLPKGDTRGPEPSKIQPWNAMDYGPSLTHCYEVPGSDLNIAYKGIAMRLDPGAGGVSRGCYWMMFDTDTLRMAAAWSAPDPPSAEQNFIDWRGIQFNGEHQIHPTVTGTVLASNPTGPGWADPVTLEFTDDQRVLGRDDRRYGPLPKAWGRFRGTYYHGQQVILSYSVGSTDVLEMPSIQVSDEPTRPPLFLRTFNIGPRDRDLVLQVAQQEGAVGERQGVSPPSTASNAAETQEKEETRRADAQPLAEGAIRFGAGTASASEPSDSLPVKFAGHTYIEVKEASDFDLTEDFTITARVRTKGNGTIFAVTQPDSPWVPDGQTFFIRDGHLAFDIGWVGAVTSKRKINDGRWHDVAAVWTKSNERLTLFVDGKPNGQGPLAAKEKLPDGVVRVGFTAPNFPEPDSFLTAELASVRFYKAALQNELKAPQTMKDRKEDLVAHWEFSKADGSVISDISGHGHDATVVRGETSDTEQGPLLAGLAPATFDASWSSVDGRLLLTIPAGNEPLRFTVWMSAEANPGDPVPAISNSQQDLQAMISGGPARWNQKITTTATIGSQDGPFATDFLTAPENNPWLAQTRFTGLDFFENGRIAVCSWDGDVWLVDGFLEGDQLTWQRIASGLYQPLGLKIVNGKIHVTCRDQLAVLHDLNGDEEIDYFECLNNDHQVTEHFHEFAMGLQTDAEGNFYYAKSGRHALEAVVPHHGTLLKVSKDGSTTEILANGFRAANGVCLNPDGSFVVTDQEGFWNPKNRINWVTLSEDRRPKFYGNMFGYHDVTDSSDDSMEPPLCWITNAFDRSPGELLWINSDRWGPLNGSLLNLSYGYGKVFLVPHESVTVESRYGKVRQMQGGMIELPIPAFPTGVMRGRFHPADGQLYLCGMFAWAGSATTPGGLYRLRATGQPIHLPAELHATTKGMKLRFTEPLKADALKSDNVQLKVWSLKRTANYGSEHYNEHPLAVRGLELSDDGRTLSVLADIEPTWCMEIRYSFQTADGEEINGVIHNTVHGTVNE